MDLPHELRADIVTAAFELERQTGMRVDFAGTMGELDAAILSRHDRGAGPGGRGIFARYARARTATMGK
jgi:hypothetical protein